MDEERKETEQEVTPAWATKLQETMDNLLSHLNPPQEEADPSEPQEIPVPQMPEQEAPPQPQETPQEEPQERPSRRKMFLDWLL